MALRLKDLQTNRKECEVKLEDGQSMKVGYLPNSISTANLNMAGEGLNNLCESLANIVVSWDILDEDDKPLEVSLDNLKKLNLVILNKIFESILSDAFPKVR